MLRLFSHQPSLLHAFPLSFSSFYHISPGFPGLFAQLLVRGPIVQFAPAIGPIQFFRDIENVVRMLRTDVSRNFEHDLNLKRMPQFL